MNSAPRLARSMIAFAVLCLPEQVASAATRAPPSESESESAAEAPDSADETLDRARALVEQGQAKFETADYQAAVELWTRAYDMVPNTAEYEPTRAFLRVNIAHAHVRAYAVDDEIEHLRKADVLFVDYLDGHSQDDEASRAEIEAERAKIAAELQRVAEASERAGEPAAESGETETETETASDARADTVETSAMPDVGPTDTPRRDRALVATGASLVALGGASLGVMAAGIGLGLDVESRGAAAAESDPSLDMVRELLAEGRGYNQMAWVSGIIGGLLVASGVTLLVVTKVRARHRGAAAGAARVTPRMEGLVLRF